MTITRRALLAAPAILAMAPASAQASKITLVVPFPPGGSTDAMARLLQSNLQTKLNRIVVVENKSGAAGALGAAQVAKSPADGSTFLVTFDSHAVIPSILDKPPVDVERELMLRPILQLGRERLPALPDTPTAIEAGFPDFETLAWWGIFAPTGTPPDVISAMASSHLPRRS